MFSCFDPDDGLNQYSTVGGTAYTYDANGNLTGNGSTTYTYDIENRLVKAVAGATTTNIVYDPLGRLFEYNQGTTATTRRFVTDGDAIVQELNGSNGLAERFVHGSNAAADDPLLWYGNAGSGLTGKMWDYGDSALNAPPQQPPGLSIKRLLAASLPLLSFGAKG